VCVCVFFWKYERKCVCMYVCARARAFDIPQAPARKTQHTGPPAPHGSLSYSPAADPGSPVVCVCVCVPGRARA
jgi:hypothetical protein